MAGTNVTGKAVLQASLGLFRQDRQMLWLPVLSTVTALVSFAVVTVPIVAFAGRSGIAVLVGLALGSVVATAATVIFNVALCFAATDRIEGRRPTVGGALGQAWRRRGVVLRWAVLSAMVGTVIRMLEQRLGLVGRIIGVAGGLAWTVATYLVIPVLAFEDVGPIEALTRSSSLFRQRFGTVARGALRFGFLFVGLSLVAVAVIVVGAVASARGAAPIGVPVVVLGVAGLIGVGMYAAAAGMYMRTILYRFAMGRPIPDLGVDVGQLFRTS